MFLGVMVPGAAYAQSLDGDAGARFAVLLPLRQRVSFPAARSIGYSRLHRSSLEDLVGARLLPVGKPAKQIPLRLSPNRITWVEGPFTPVLRSLEWFVAADPTSPINSKRSPIWPLGRPGFFQRGCVHILDLGGSQALRRCRQLRAAGPIRHRIPLHIQRPATVVVGESPKILWEKAWRKDAALESTFGIFCRARSSLL